MHSASIPVIIGHPHRHDAIGRFAVAIDLRDHLCGILRRIADMADGVRCDMAMLAVSEVFSRTWASRYSATGGNAIWQSCCPNLTLKLCATSQFT